MRRALILAALFACTPAEQQTSAKAVADAAQCIEAHSQPGADPGTVAISCGIAEIPDVVAIIVAVIDAKTLAAKRPECVRITIADAGTPLDGAGK